MKFQLTRDTLEAMLRSMTYISEQLSTLVRMLSSSTTCEKLVNNEAFILLIVVFFMGTRARRIYNLGTWVRR